MRAALGRVRAECNAAPSTERARSVAFPVRFSTALDPDPRLRPELGQLVGEALKRERSERPASVREFARRLRVIAGSGYGQEERNQNQQSPGMQYCSRCGVEISADASRCPSCGATAVVSQPSIPGVCQRPSTSVIDNRSALPAMQERISTEGRHLPVLRSIVAT